MQALDRDKNHSILLLDVKMVLQRISIVKYRHCHAVVYVDNGWQRFLFVDWITVAQYQTDIWLCTVGR